MATYKVLQDIEAEDKFVGALTLKQFILIGATAVGLYLSFFFFSKGIWIVALILFPFEVVTGFLGFPWGRDQPTETWLLAKLRFYFKPRKRIWDQTGMQELVKITAPKKVEQVLTDGLSSTEVKSRLKALADTIDSRGWVIKNVDVNMFAQPAYGSVGVDSDRLVDTSALPQQASISDVTDNDDIFSNSTAARLDSQIAQSKQQHKQTAVKKMEKATQPEDPKPNFWFFDQPKPDNAPKGYTTFQTEQVSSPTPAGTLPASFRKDEPLDNESAALLNKVHRDKDRAHQSFRNHRNLDPIDRSKPVMPAMTATPPPDILNLAIDNHRKVDSLAREARKNHPEQPESKDDEVIISLH